MTTITGTLTINGTSVPFSGAFPTPAAAPTAAQVAAAPGFAAAVAALLAPAPAALSIRVSGSKLVDQNGSLVRIKGVNVSALEAVPIAGWSPTDPWGGRAPNLAAVKSWGVNTLRIPLNEASCLGLTCYDYPIAPATVGVARQADPGLNTLSTLKATVDAATAAGMYIILDNHIGSPRASVPGIAGVVQTTANCQNPAANADNSPKFWSMIAGMFKGYQNVMFDIFNEPHIDGFTGVLGFTDPTAWIALRDGGTCNSFMAGTGPGTNLLNEQVFQSWQSAGMQSLVNAIRATGATNVILSAGLSYAQYMQGWATYAPVDPLKQIAASWHPYASQTDNTKPGFATSFADVQAILAAGYPVVATETGDYDDAARATWLPVLLPWLTANGIGACCWTWDAWGQAQFNLILDAAGTPTPGEGVLWKAW
jgi:endoglucanase